MSDKKFPPGGVLWKNNRKNSSTHPDMTGHLEISTDLLKFLVSLATNGEPLKMDLSAWTRENQNKNKFLSISAKQPWVQNDGWERRQPVNTEAKKTKAEHDEILDSFLGLRNKDPF